MRNFWTVFLCQISVKSASGNWSSWKIPVLTREDCLNIFNLKKELNPAQIHMSQLLFAKEQ